MQALLTACPCLLLPPAPSLILLIRLFACLARARSEGRRLACSGLTHRSPASQSGPESWALGGLGRQRRADRPASERRRILEHSLPFCLVSTSRAGALCASVPHPPAPASRAHLLFLLFLGSRRLRLLLHQRRHMLLAEAEGPPPREQLSVGSRLAAGVAAAHMRFDCFHNKKREPPYRGLMAGTVQAPLAAPSQRERGGPTCTDLREDSPSYMISHQGTLRPGAGRPASQPV